MTDRPRYRRARLAPALLWVTAGFVAATTVCAHAAADLGLRLVGTMVTDDPARNCAVIEDQATRSQSTRCAGDRLRGEIVIRRIESGQVVVGTSTGDQVLAIASGERTDGRGLRTRLDRTEVDTTLPDYMRLLRAIRIRPHFETGQPAGILVYSIEPDTMFARMGLENGDVIKAVNGRPVATTLQTVDFYEALKTSTVVSLEIVRREATRELQFEIR